MGLIEQLGVLAALTAVASFAAGMLGAGGGIILMPLLIYAPGLLGGNPYDVRTASSLAAVQAVFAAVGGGLHADAWESFGRRQLTRLGPALVLASFAGGAVSVVLSADLLLVAFAVLTTVGVIALLLPKDEQAKPMGHGHSVVAGILMSVVALSGGAVGAGYGPLLVAILLHVTRLPTRAANSTALVLGIFTALPGLLGKISTGQVPFLEASLVAAVTVLFVFIGRHTSRAVPTRMLRWSLAAVTGALAAQVWAALVVPLTSHSR